MDKQAFFASCALKTEEYTTPAGETILLKELTAGQRGVLRKVAEGDPVEGQCRIVVLGCDLFRDEDLPALMELPGSIVAEMADVILRLSGLGDDSVKEAKND